MQCRVVAQSGRVEVFAQVGVWLLELEDCTVELALDKGFLRGGVRMALLGEVEVELKSGTEEAAIAFARSLAVKYGLAVERVSKYRRALALTGRI